MVHEDAVEGVDYHLDARLPFWQLTNEQDWELCARAQRGILNSRYTPGPLSTSWTPLTDESKPLWRSAASMTLAVNVRELDRKVGNYFVERDRMRGSSKWFTQLRTSTVRVFSSQTSASTPSCQARSRRSGSTWSCSKRSM